MVDQIHRALIHIIDNLRHENSAIKITARNELKSFLSEIQNLNTTDKSTILEFLFKALEHNASDMQYYVVEFLGKLGDKKAIEPIAILLTSENSSVRFAAAQSLCNLGDERGFDTLLNMIGDGTDVEGGLVAAETLGEFNYIKALPVLIEWLNDSRWEVRQNAVCGLGCLRDKQAVEPLIQLLNDTSSQVRSSTAEALGMLDDAQAVDALLKALTDADVDVRYSVVVALGKIGNKSVLPALKLVRENDIGFPTFELDESMKQIAIESIKLIKERYK